MVFDLHFKNRIEKKKKQLNTKTKKDPVKMWKIYTALNSDFKKIYDYDAYKKKQWQGEYVFSGRDSYSGERWCVKLKDFINEMFDENICRNYKF